jgi:hypothetical protein
MEIQQTSFKAKILIRCSFYRNYLLRYMCINFLSNRPQADGEWQKLHSHAYTRATVCSFVSFTYYQSYFEEMDSNKDTPLTLPFALFISLSQLIIVTWIKTSLILKSRDFCYTSSLLEQQDLCKNRERRAATMMNDNTWVCSHDFL